VPTRRYDASARQQAAAQTRHRLLAAARELLADPTVPRLTADTIAQRAGSSRQTLYNAFGSLGGLLEALCDELASAAELDLQVAFGQPNPEAAIERFVDSFCRLWETDRLVLRRLRGLAVVDPDLDAVLRARDGRRRAALQMLLNRYRVPLEPELVEVLWTLTGFETYDLLAGGNRDRASVAATLSTALCRLLGAADPPPAGQ
jgi:AcrR family transcriptional regulator